MKKLLPLMMMSFILVGCDAIDGTLKVHESITLQAKKTGLFSKGTVDVKVPATVYRAKINPTSEKNINLEMNVSGKDYKFPFAIAKGTKIPEIEGHLTIRSDESGQPFDLEAIVRTDVSSSYFSQNESCVITYRTVQRCDFRPVRRCRIIQPEREICEIRKNNHRDPRGGGPGPGRGNGPGHHPGPGTRVCTKIPAKEMCETHQERYCRTEQVAVYGNQVVDYEKRISVKHIDVDMVDKGNVVAQFTHSSSKTNNIRRGASSCR